MSSTKAELLIVEDEPEIAELIEFHAERAGMRARKVHSGRIALDVVKREKPDIIVLDLMLPDVDGLEVCRRLKQDEATRGVPIVMVTAKGEEADVVAGIELGAHDYVTKPFSPRVLMARLRNILRRTQPIDEPSQKSDRMVLLAGRLVIDLDRHEVAIDGRNVDLTLTEFGILHYLAGRPGFVRTRDQIIAAVHGKSTVLSSRTVDVHITALRRKLGSASECVETVRGVGYRFADAREDGE
jgi:two-component system alkaline phosphatase synthesis response regulator PhoP